MYKRTLIASAVLTALVGCATTTPEQNASNDNDLSKSLPATAAGMKGHGRIFASPEDAAKALAGYNYALTALPNGKFEAIVSGENGSGANNQITAGAAKGASATAAPIRLAAADPAEETPFPAITLPEKKNGQAAITALGDNLNAVAKAYDMSPERLQHILRTDPTAWIDESGRLLYVEGLAKFPDHKPTEATQTAATAPKTAAITADTDPFMLHSKPGSNRVIYLDFNGHVVTNSAWYTGTLTAKPYDLDGNPTAFSTTELNNIREIWQRVAEEYAPFDVDVTTQEPTPDALLRTSSTDMQYGSRAVITRSMPELCNQACGGIAYINVFSYYSTTTPDRFQPAWVFFDKLANGYPKYVAEAAAHEVGHNLNLNHDGNASTGYYSGQGTGNTGWAPIMGVGYYKPVTQWSKGEYPSANNLQDDIAVIASAGAALRPDDYPNTTATAAPLGGDAAAIVQNGIIGQDTDVDMFVFSTGGGNVQINAAPDSLSPNVDILLKILDAQGKVVAESNPLDSLSASLTATLNSGKYFLQVEGVGMGDLTTGYSGYGSIGKYQLTGSYPVGVPLPPTATVSALPTLGDAPLTVALNGSNSADPDGTIAAYSWDFGDGSTPGTAATVSHVYNKAGKYTATLTVTDNSGLKSSASQVIDVTQPPVPVVTAMKVASTEVTNRPLSGGKSQCLAKVTVNYGTAPIAGAVMSGAWSGSVSSGTTKTLVTGVNSGTTSSTGMVTLSSAVLPSKSKGTCAFTVNNVTKTGYTYDASGAITGSYTW